MSLTLVLLGCGAAALSGVPGLFLDRRSRTGQGLATFLHAAGSALGLVGAAEILLTGEVRDGAFAWFLPWGNGALRLDPLAAFFLVPVFLVPSLGSIYGQGYWRQSEHVGNGRKLRFFYGVLAGSMGLVVLARDSVLFLISWEAMALAAFFLVTTEDEDSAACRSGWIYLVATHLGTVCLLSLFSFLRRATGTTMWVGLADVALEPGALGVVFVLTLLGFGFKAGLLPLHVWLPGAHANAPSHVSAVMSGVMLKMGIYGILRVSGLLPRLEAWYGGVLLAAGAGSAVLGVILAVAQSDLKRALAYSSIENVGIITMGIGLAFLGVSRGREDWTALGLAKSLLFFNAGAVIHAVHTREIRRLGGLARRMPRTASIFVVGACALCALPGLNGFVSEWFLYSGLFRTLGGPAEAPGEAWPLAALGVPALALVGALALACFVNLLGSVFLGAPRSESAGHARDPGAWMRAPMVLLAVACGVVGLLPAPFVGLLERVIPHWRHGGPGAIDLPALAPVRWISILGGTVVGSALLLGFLYALLRRRGAVGSAVTWDCGYAAPTARMQYTPSSFAAWIADLFRWSLWRKVHRPQVSGLFPQTATFKSVQPDPLLDRAVLPALHGTARLFAWLRLLQQGRTQIYMLYSLVILVVLFWWGRNGR